MKFVTYDPTSGRIIQTGDVPDSMISLQGEYVIAGIASSETHYVDVSSKQLVAKPPRPGDDYRWNYSSRLWELDSESAASNALRSRAYLLSSSDWTQLPDVSLATKEAWATYRQALRDITAQPGYPFDIVWPVSP